MPVPLNYTEKQEIQERVVKLQKQIAVQEKSKTAIINEEIPKNNTSEATNKKVYDYYHDIITAYETEIRQLNSFNITTPISETDLLNRVNLNGRLYNMNELDLVRIGEFDGAGTTTTTGNNENTFWPTYQPHLTRLTSGLSTSFSNTESAAGTITPASTNIQILGSISPPAGIVGKEFVCYDTPTPGQSFIGVCTAIIGLSGGPYSINFDFVTPITANITGATLDWTWTGFNNTERTNKTSVNFQTILNYYVSQLQAIVPNHLPYLQNQVTALTSNQDDALDATALTKVQSTISFLQNFQTVTDISNTGISTFQSKVSSRQTEITARITAANSAKAVHYDKRFNWAVQRAGSKGTLTTAKALVDAIANLNYQISKANADLLVLQNP